MTIYEIITSTANIGILIVGVVGLNQLRIGLQQINISKEDIYIRNKRESITLTASLCEKFPVIINRCNEIEKIIKESDENIFKEVRKFKFPLDKKLLCEGYVKQNKVLSKYLLLIQKSNLAGETSKFVNDMEAFSIYFKENVADKEIGYITIGRSYCDVVEILLPLIMLSRCEGCQRCNDSNKKLYYDNILELYFTWKSRIELESNKDIIERNIITNESLINKSVFDTSIGLNKKSNS